MDSLKLRGVIKDMWTDDEGLHVLTEESCATFKTLEEFDLAVLEQQYAQG